MIKKIEWLTPNKMKFESEFKTFNAAADLITTGAVISNVQFSEFLTKDWNLNKAFPEYYINIYRDT